MSIDGASYPCTSLPLSYWLAHARRSHPTAYRFCISSLRQSLGLRYKRIICMHSCGAPGIRTPILHLSIYPGARCTNLHDRDHVHNGFFERVSGKKRKPCAQKLTREDSYREEESSDLETKILEFMDKSETPELFPSRSELIKAGRSDLVEAILAKGGWMVAGWDMELSSGEQAGRLADSMTGEGNGRVWLKPLEIQDKQLAFLESSLSYSDVLESTTKFNTAKETYGLIPASNRASQSARAVSSLERQKGWEKVAGLFGLSSLTKSMFADEFGSHKRNDLDQLLPGGRDFLESSTQAFAENKRRGEKSARNRTYPPGNETTVSAKKKASKKGCSSTRNRSPRRKSEKQQEGQNNTSPLSDRIRGLEAELISTLDILKSGRQALSDDITENQRHSKASKELEEVSDALEFCETEIMNKKIELRTVRAQRTALEGKLALDLMESKKDLEEKDRQLAEGMQVLKMLREVRIVWANPAFEVFLAGSFDGWASWRRMEKSSAGVFVTALQLYPGQYEIKFIVNGEWRVDPNRPVTWANGYENNVLTIL